MSPRPKKPAEPADAVCCIIAGGFVAFGVHRLLFKDDDWALLAGGFVVRASEVLITGPRAWIESIAEQAQQEVFRANALAILVPTTEPRIDALHRRGAAAQASIIEATKGILAIKPPLPKA